MAVGGPEGSANSAEAEWPPKAQMHRATKVNNKQDGRAAQNKQQTQSWSGDLVAAIGMLARIIRASETGLPAVNFSM